ncbi:hypothetical protein ACP70R_042858 [Stipagrostis hirtigluma subsp. patula]
MADVENPNGGGVVTAAADPDDESGCGLLLFVALVVCALVAVSVLPVLFYRDHRRASLAVRVAAAILLVPAIIGFTLAACLCAILVEFFLFGNIEGTQQADEPAPLP